MVKKRQGNGGRVKLQNRRTTHCALKLALSLSVELVKGIGSQVEVISYLGMSSGAFIGHEVVQSLQRTMG